MGKGGAGSRVRSIEMRRVGLATHRVVVNLGCLPPFWLLRGENDVRDHRKLEVFRLADELAVAVYRETREMPRSERVGLTSQMRRAAVSVPTNIVEGCGRQTEAEFSRFLHIAFGSVREVGYLVDLSERLGFLSRDSAACMKETQGRTAAALAAFIQRRTSFENSTPATGSIPPARP